MKRIIFFSVVTLALMGCGGGNQSQAGTSQKISQDDSVIQGDNQKTESAKSTDTKSVPDQSQVTVYDDLPEAHPYPAPTLSEEDISAFLEVINAARVAGQDCGKLDSRGRPVKDSEGRYIYDGSNIMAPAKALKWNNALYTAAYEHSKDLVESNTASHLGSGTASDWTGMDRGGERSYFSDRLENNGYRHIDRVGENITMGTHRDTIQKAVTSWLRSPEHCINLMNPLYTEVGVAHVGERGTTYTHYWTQELGVRDQ